MFCLCMWWIYLGLCKLLHAAIAPVFGALMAACGMHAVLKVTVPAASALEDGEGMDVDGEAPLRHSPPVIREVKTLKDLPAIMTQHCLVHVTTTDTV